MARLYYIPLDDRNKKGYRFSAAADPGGFQNGMFYIYYLKLYSMTTIHWALFHANPSSQPPFITELGISENGEKKQINIDNCEHIPDAVEKIKKYVEENTLELAKPFTLLYPIYMDMMNSDFESTMHQIAWLIKDEADKNGWDFNRVGGLSGTKTEDFYK